jgi:hypothetical protein
MMRSGRPRKNEMGIAELINATVYAVIPLGCEDIA